jgi:hypothetical protein
MSTAELYVQTSFVLNAAGRIVVTREPGGTRGPLLSIVRSGAGCAWAVRADVPEDVARELDQLARDEPPARDLRDPPLYARRYIAMLAERLGTAGTGTKMLQSDGPAFSFPDALPQPSGVVVIEDEELLQRNFRGWARGEIRAGRAPVFAVVESGYPVSVCFCARSSDAAAQAGLETAGPYRRRGFGARVTAAWALAIRASGRVPLYSTSWSNRASLGVARRLSLMACASTWSLSD